MDKGEYANVYTQGQRIYNVDDTTYNEFHLHQPFITF